MPSAYFMEQNPVPSSPCEPSNRGVGDGCGRPFRSDSMPVARPPGCCGCGRPTEPGMTRSADNRVKTRSSMARPRWQTVVAMWDAIWHRPAIAAASPSAAPSTSSDQVRQGARILRRRALHSRVVEYAPPPHDDGCLEAEVRQTHEFWCCWLAPARRRVMMDAGSMKRAAGVEAFDSGCRRQVGDRRAAVVLTFRRRAAVSGRLHTGGSDD